MKKVTYVIFALLLVLYVTFDAYAQDTISYKLCVPQTYDKVKSLDVDIYAHTGNSTLLSSVLSVTYDSNIVVFKKVSSDLYEVKATDNNNVVKLVFADTYGVCADNDTKIATLKFESLQTGTFNMDIDCSESIDDNLSYLDVSTLYGSTVTISDSGIMAKSYKISSDASVKGKSKSSSGLSSKKKDQSKDNSSMSNAEKDKGASGIKAFSINDDNSKFIVPFLCGAGVVIAVVIIFVLGVKYGKITKNDQ